jgi:hypothetical protein
MSKITVAELTDCNTINFPIKSFFVLFCKKIFSFYRQGHSFDIDPEAPENYSI